MPEYSDPTTPIRNLDPGTLAAERCVPCEGGTPPLPREEAERLAAGIDPAWELRDDRLEREFRLASFNAAFGLAARIALLAESQGHHPDLELGWGRLHVTWTTHAIGGLSENDFVMAARVDRLIGRGLGLKEE